jgi:hypothetical protein
MSNKNQQMKIAVVAVLVILLISSIIAAVRSSTSSEPTIKTKDASATSQDVAAKKELVKAVEDLETIKDRIKNVEEGYRENYRSETNNGLTVVGTLMEQMIDVMVAVLKQPLVAEAVSKRIVNKQDADEIAEYIEMLGQEVVKEVEQTRLLRCSRPMVENMSNVQREKKKHRESNMANPWNNVGMRKEKVMYQKIELRGLYEFNHMKIRRRYANAQLRIYTIKFFRLLKRLKKGIKCIE